MLLGSALAWYQLFRTLEHKPRAIQSARQVASLVNLSRAALIHSDAIARISLIKTLAEQEKVRIAPHEPDDRFTFFDNSPLEQRISEELVARLGPGTLVASRVNDEPGLWVGFSIEGDSYWLLRSASSGSALRFWPMRDSPSERTSVCSGRRAGGSSWLGFSSSSGPSWVRR